MPVTRTLFRDPVFTAAGHTYEREAMETWLQNQRRVADFLAGRSRARAVRDDKCHLDGWRTLVTRLLFETQQREYLEAAQEAVNFLLETLVQMDLDAEAIERDASAEEPIADMWWRCWHNRVRFLRSSAGNAQAWLSCLDRESAAGVRARAASSS